MKANGWIIQIKQQQQQQQSGSTRIGGLAVERWLKWTSV
jgi:hypothetical protein